MTGEITAPAVRAIFREILRGEDKVPGIEACREAATWLQFLRLRRARPPASKVGEAGAPGAARAALTVLAELARLETIHAQFQSDIARVPSLPMSEPGLRERAVMARKVRAARAALEQILPTLAAKAAPGPSWHEEAAGLFRVFLAAMKEANPGRVYAPSNDGAAVRFIRAAFAVSVGEERRETAIAQALKRMRRGGTARAAATSRDKG